MKKQIKQIFNPLSGGFDSIQVTDATKDASQLMLLTADEPISEWSNITGGFSISKVDPLFGDASYVLEMTNLKIATYKVIPVDIGFRGTTVALTLDYLMLDGAARVELLDQDNNLIDGAQFDIPAANGKERFGTTVFIPSTVTGIRFKVESRATVAGGSFKFDNVQLSSDLLKSVDISNDADWIPFTPTGTWNVNTNYAGRWRRVGDSMEVQVDISLTGEPNSGPLVVGLPPGYKIDTTKLSSIISDTKQVGIAGATNTGILSYPGGKVMFNSEDAVWVYVDNLAGDYLWVTHTYPFSFGVDDRVTMHFTVPIKGWTASNPGIVAPTDQVTERSIAFRWRSPAQATEANLSATGQIGDYVTGQYAANTNTLTQCTTRPDQSDADMSINGPRIYTRAYNVDSTAALPTRFVIKIAEPNQLAACDVKVYKNAGKQILGSLDMWAKDQYILGSTIKGFDPVTGILTIDLGYAATEVANTVRSIDFSDHSAQNNGYICFTASKLAQGVAIPTPKVAARAVNTSGQSIPSDAYTTVTYNAVKSFDTTNSLNTSTGIFTAPEDGYYSISGRVTFTAYGGTSTVIVAFAKNGTTMSTNREIVGTNVFEWGGGLSDIVHLTKGDTLAMTVFQNTGSNKTLHTETGSNFFSVAKINIG